MNVINKIKERALRPYALLALACLFVTFWFDVTAERPVSLVLTVIGAALSGWLAYERKQPVLWLGAAFFLLTYLLCGLSNGSWSMMILIGLAVIAAAAIWLVSQEKLTVDRAVVLLVLAGLILRLGYTLYTGVEVRQHDVHLFGGPDGHAAYIEYIYQHGSLPQGDPRETWQFYHPPFHAICSAAWLRLLTLCGIGWERAKESLQFLTLFYSGAFMFTCVRLFRGLGLQKKGLLIATALIAFHPTGIILSGSVNNDMLSLLFMAGAILYSLKWYQEPSWKNTVVLALCYGWGMMTKLSVALAAPATACLMLMRLYRSTERGRLCGKLGVFGGISFPLGLWWGVRNLVGYGVPPTYVPMMTDTSWQYVGFHGIAERLLDFSGYQFRSLFMSFGRIEEYMEFNPTVGLFKTAVFGEFDLAGGRTAVLSFTTGLFWIHAVLALLSTVAIVAVLLRRRSGLSGGTRLFLGVLYATVFYSYYQFCLGYAHTCTMNIRYAVPLIVVGAVCLGLWSEKHRSVRIASGVLTVGFCAFSAVTYTLLGV